MHRPERERKRQGERVEESESKTCCCSSTMSETDSPAVRSPASKKQFSEADLPSQKKKTLSSFLYKAILFAVFVALLPLFPPQIPDSANPTLLSRTWELLQLLLVGIAVSYGLFSQRNADPGVVDRDKDASFKADTPHSYVSRILQISPVFDDDMEPEEIRAETWSSQYHGVESIVVESKPLLLPVRSLRESRVQSPDDSLLGSSSSSTVLPSPIPWSTRSGRIEVGDVTEASSPTPALYRKSGSSSSELRGKTSEDPIRRKGFHGSTPPPAPPPPPPFNHVSPFYERRELRRSFKDELKDLRIKGGEQFLRSSSRDAPQQLKSEISSSSKEAQSVEKSPAPLQQKKQAETCKKKKKVGFVEEIMLDDSENGTGSDSYDDDEEAVDSSTEARAQAKENEVDKKADEFIAKFREQIRLQRIQSIKKSSTHRAVQSL